MFDSSLASGFSKVGFSMTSHTAPASHTQFSQYLEVIERLIRGEYQQDVPVDTEDDLGKLGRALQDLADTLHRQQRQTHRLAAMTNRINAGLTLSEILENVYDDFREIVPYNRIGLALILADGETIRAEWTKSDGRQILLRRGYLGSLENSSLGQIMRTREPRILNDLREYLRQKPDSEATRLIVEEGYQSSLTFPLIVENRPVGFIFFTSAEPYTYQRIHVDTLKQVAQQLAIIVEKGRLVTELANQARAIERQNHELVHVNELKNTFVGIVAHDLRSPLGVIEMGIDYIREAGTDLSEEDRTTVLDGIAKHIRHMLSLIDELLDVTQIESGTLALVRADVDIAGLVEEVVSHHTRLAAPKNIQIALASSEIGKVRADPQRLRQVMDNLISNAVKYSPLGSQVVIRSRIEGDSWYFAVEDQGPGIQPEERGRLFTEFGRLSSRPTGGERSTGLGLAISRRMIEAHGGQIGVDSEPGKGSVFWFRLPA